MNMTEIREEQSADIDEVRELNRQAFDQEQEGRIVDALRDAGVVTLALVAISDGVVVGHIVFSPLTVGTEVGVALGPMAVNPAYQGQGIGSELVAQGMERLRRLGCPFVVVIGHPEFYPRFRVRSRGGAGPDMRVGRPGRGIHGEHPQRGSGPSSAGTAQYRAEFSTID